MSLDMAISLVRVIIVATLIRVIRAITIQTSIVFSVLLLLVIG